MPPIVCTRCAVAKDDGEFPQLKGKRHGRVCKECKTAYIKEWVERNPAKRRDTVWRYDYRNGRSRNPVPPSRREENR